MDKPAGMTSHDVVDRARRLLGTRKVGHAGTLDPDVTGVLLLGVGQATRLLRFVVELPKTYAGQVVLGTETTTLDAGGETTATHDMAGVGLDDVRAAAAGLVGDILQVPPMVSAVRVGGRRLHELAREGVEVERAPRPVTVYRFDVPAEVEPGVFAVEVECSSGTYVRSLAADLGRALGGGAHLRTLRRTAVGPWTVAEARAVGAAGPPTRAGRRRPPPTGRGRRGDGRPRPHRPAPVEGGAHRLPRRRALGRGRRRAAGCWPSTRPGTPRPCPLSCSLPPDAHRRPRPPRPGPVASSCAGHAG